MVDNAKFYVQSRIISENNWAFSVDQCWLQALQFSMQKVIKMFEEVLVSCEDVR